MSKNVTATEMIERCFNSMMKRVGTSIPGHVAAFDPGTQMAQIQPGIQRIDGAGGAATLPLVIEVPVCFVGGGYCVEYQIDPGAEGLLIIAQRCIDAWVNQGGVARPPILRFHDMNDALFIPGFRSQPGRLQSFENNGVRLRNSDGSQFIWLKNDGTAEITVSALNITGDVNIEGATDIQGAVSTTGTLTNNSINVGSTHTHTGVVPGGGSTGTPAP